MSTTNPVPEDALNVAVAAFPEWLAAEVRAWIRKAERGGRTFPTVGDAVRAALSAASQVA